MATYLWRPVGIRPKAVIQFSHGMCEYVERYEEWARRFVEKGYIFCGNDHLGHGHTAPDKESFGYTARRGGADCLVEDLHTMTRLTADAYPGLPIVLYGHSMGSFAARLCLSRYGEEYAAALLCGTAGPEQPTALGIKLVREIIDRRGAHYRSRALTALALGNYNKRFFREDDVYAWLTRDKAARKAHARDPLCGFIFTAAGYETLFSLLDAVSDKEWPNTLPKQLPVLLFSGAMDPVGRYGKGVRTVFERMQRAGCNVRLKLYPKGRHEMHNELNKDEVFADLTQFLEDVLP